MNDLRDRARGDTALEVDVEDFVESVWVRAADALALLEPHEFFPLSGDMHAPMTIPPLDERWTNSRRSLLQSRASDIGCLPEGGDTTLPSGTGAMTELPPSMLDRVQRATVLACFNASASACDRAFGLAGVGPRTRHLLGRKALALAVVGSLTPLDLDWMAETFERTGHAAFAPIQPTEPTVGLGYPFRPDRGRWEFATARWWLEPSREHLEQTRRAFQRLVPAASPEFRHHSVLRSVRRLSLVEQWAAEPRQAILQTLREWVNALVEAHVPPRVAPVLLDRPD